ncbi:MAG: hypothetical protein [Inoviridae sp.]|nr:MAG: hypothetical protein [Inoviridae sp.]
MKKFFVYVLVCFLLCNSVLADFEEVVSGETEIPPEEVDEVVDKLPALVESSVSEDSPGELPAEMSPGGNTIYLVGGVMDNDGASSANPVLTDAVVAYGLAPVKPSDTSGVKAVLLSFIGNYDPPIVQYEYSSSNGYKQYVNEIQPDYVWICSFALIALFIYCLFKLGGGLLRG